MELNGVGQKTVYREIKENMSIELPETDHHIVISADSHCGADLRGYKPYLEKKYHDDFEEWAAASEEAAKQQEALFAGRGRSTRNVGIDLSLIHI